MEDGDLSNEVAPRAIYVFEGLIGRPSGDVSYARAKLAETTRRWKRAVRYYEIDQMTKAILWDQIRRYTLQFDIVTFKAKPFAEALKGWLDDNDIPVSHVYATTPTELAKSLAYMPYVRWVIDPDPRRRFAYGDRGTTFAHLREARFWM